MQNRYDYMLDGFYNRVVFYIRDVHPGAGLGDVDKDASGVLQRIDSNLNKLHDNSDAELDEINVKASWFAKDKDYHAYYAFMEMYHAMTHYYRYHAKYNMKDEKLKNAWREWNRVINPKQSNLSYMISEIARKRQK